MTTPIYELPDWAAAQATPWNNHNASLRMLEAAVRGLVLDRDLTAPPGSCADGATYLVDATATGAWAGHDGEMAVAVGANAVNGWLFVAVATEGAILFVDDEDLRIEYRSDLSPAGWLEFDTGGGISDAPSDGVTYGRKNAAWVPLLESIIIAASDETTDITTGTKVTFRMPYAFTLVGLPRASVTTAPTGSAIIVDINEEGASIFSTLLTIDAGEETSTTATPAVVSDTVLADDAKMTVDIDQVGSTIPGAGLKVTLIGYRS